MIYEIQKYRKIVFLQTRISVVALETIDMCKITYPVLERFVAASVGVSLVVSIVILLLAMYFAEKYSITLQIYENNSRNHSITKVEKILRYCFLESDYISLHP